MPSPAWLSAWMQGGLTRDHPQTVGKWRVIHAPEANYNWGGSFVAIPEQSKNKEAAWKFVQWACCTAEGQNVLFKKSGVFRPTSRPWQDPLYDAPVDFFGGQKAYKPLGKRSPITSQRSCARRTTSSWTTSSAPS